MRQCASLLAPALQGETALPAFEDAYFTDVVAFALAGSGYWGIQPGKTNVMADWMC